MTTLFLNDTSPTGAPILKMREFEKISKLAYERFGLDIPKTKLDLVAARLGKILRQLGMNSFEQYCDYVQSDRSGAALTTLADRLTTNHTSFFREPRHFDILRRIILPEVRMRSRIDIWSAACSSGEEPYTIAMSLLEEMPEAVSRVHIKATDLSTRVLATARQGVYPLDKVQSIAHSLRQKYMVREESSRPSAWRFKPEVRKMVEFERLNLMETLPRGYRCSVIFCRNIMIYFDKPTQQRLVQRLSRHLEDGGYLFIGHSENLSSVVHGLDYVSPAAYRKPGCLNRNTGGVFTASGLVKSLNLVGSEGLEPPTSCL